MGLGEYLTLWVIIGVIILAILGLFFGAALGGAAVFAIGGALAVLIIYGILSRVWRLFLHGNMGAGGNR
jgi:hypothetical protein